MRALLTPRLVFQVVLLELAALGLLNTAVRVVLPG